MSVQLFKNNAETTLNGTLAIGSVTVVLPSGHGNRFPTPSGGDYFYLTIYEKNGSGVEITYEVVKCTARVGDVLTVVRDAEGLVQEAGGTSGGWAYPSAVGVNPSQIVYLSLRYTAYAAGNTLNKDGNLSGLASASTSRTNLGLGSIATQNSNNVSITGGSISGVTLTDSTSIFADDADPTKKMQFQLSSIGAGLTRTLTVPNNDITLGGTNIANTWAATQTFADITATGNATLGDAEATDTHSIKGATTLLTNSASAALTITQTGAGNALVVEDSASPDSSPLVVDSTGRMVIGNTAALNVSGDAGFESLQVTGVNASADISSSRFSVDATGPNINFGKSRGASVGANTVVASGDSLGAFTFNGGDGSGFVIGARIRAEVDGTPGTNDMPGRLVFSTTADGASTTTERMRIDSAGNVGIGITPNAGITLHLQKQMTGASTVYGLANWGQVQPTATGAAYFSSAASAAANGGTPYTITGLSHYSAVQGVFNADATVTNQYGFNALNSLSGAVNNYGFYGSIASGTDRTITFVARTTNVSTVTTSVAHGFKVGQKVVMAATTNTGFNGLATITATPTTDTFTYANTGADVATVADTGTAYNYANFNLFMNSTAPNYFGGKTWVNVSSTEPALRVTQTGTGNAFVVEDSTSPDSTPFAIDGNGKVVVGKSAADDASAILQVYSEVAAGPQQAIINNFDAASAGYLKFQKRRVTGNAVVAQDTIGTLLWQGHDGTSAIQAALITAAVDGTPGTNDMPGRLVFSTTADGASTTTERMRIDAAGQVGIGVTPVAGRSLQIGKNLTGATSTYGVQMNGTIQPDSTVSSYGFSASIATAANAGVGYTISSVSGFNVSQGTFHADSTVSSQYGFSVGNTLIGAANNVGFYANISAAASRWNFYAAGTAPNYFAGDLRSGTVVTQATSPTNSDVTATATASSLLGGIRTGTPAAAIDLQVPTGTNMDAAFTSLQNDQSFEWSAINLAGATYAITVTANTAHTLVGNMVVAANTSGRFLTRKTATNTFITYRIS